jgi:hypothetical protein
MFRLKISFIMLAKRMMWKFLDDPKNLPLTNNHAECQIRHYVIYRKNSYFTQSKRGNDFAPSQAAAKLEASKSFTKGLCVQKHNICVNMPSSRSYEFV